MKAELSLFGFLVTPRNYYTGVSETAPSTYDCSRFAPGRDALVGQFSLPRNPRDSPLPRGVRKDGREGGGDPQSESVYTAERQRPLGGCV